MAMAYQKNSFDKKFVLSSGDGFLYFFVESILNLFYRTKRTTLNSIQVLTDKDNKIYSTITDRRMEIKIKKRSNKLITVFVCKHF